MKRRLLAVMPTSTNYISYFEVTSAHSFAAAKRILEEAVLCRQPFDCLDLPVSDEKAFWDFLEWMKQNGRIYPFSIFGAKNDQHFWKIVEDSRNAGFHVNT